MTDSSDVYICFLGVLEKVESSFIFTELKETDLSFLNELPKEAMAKCKKRPYSESVSTGESFWLIRKSILHCRKTFASIPA
jgi:hypothetical protein